MKPWARYSILVIGALLAAFGGLSLVGILIAALAGPMLPSSTQNPGVTGVFGLGMNIFIIWLLHRERAAFTPPRPAPPAVYAAT